MDWEYNNLKIIFSGEKIGEYGQMGKQIFDRVKRTRYPFVVIFF